MESEAITGAVDWWARGIGLSALGVALLGLGWTIYNAVFRDRARIRARVATGGVQNYPGVDGEQWLWFIEVMNQGRRPISISSLPGLELPNGRYLVFNSRFGEAKPIQEGEKAIFWTYESALSSGLKREGHIPNRILIKDDAGRDYRRRIHRKYLKLIRQLVSEEVSKGSEATQAHESITTE